MGNIFKQTGFLLRDFLLANGNEFRNEVRDLNTVVKEPRFAKGS